MVRRKATVAVGGGGGGGGLKPVILVRNLTLISDAVSNNKYILFSPLGFLYLICETSQLNPYNQKHCDEPKQRAQWRPDTRTQQDHGEPDHKY